MPTWNELLVDLAQVPVADKASWITAKLNDATALVGQQRGGRNVIFYASAFLQKPTAPPMSLSITAEDLNGFMPLLHGLDTTKGLSLILHTPGGVANAAETVVSYLRSKFDDIEVIVPAYAMSAGTMIALAANRLVMGRQSQLGPIDPQLTTAGRSFSAQAIVDQFERAKAEILANQAAAHVWATILPPLGPSLLQEAQNALDYGERMVAHWLASFMFAGDVAKANATAHHFNDAASHKSHGRRIDRDEARLHGVVVDDLETDQSLQEAVLTAYHLVTLIFEQSPAAKIIMEAGGKQWLKNLPTPSTP